MTWSLSPAAKTVTVKLIIKHRHAEDLAYAWSMASTASCFESWRQIDGNRPADDQALPEVVDEVGIGFRYCG